VNDDWPETVSATGNTVSDATMALLYTQAGEGNADDPLTLANFLNKGGKVIWYHGGSDSLITPFRSFWYYEQLASLHGGYSTTQDSVRMFIVLGMGHCGGGCTQTPNSFDTLQALHNWVAKGVPPEGIVAAATNTAARSVGRRTAMIAPQKFHVRVLCSPTFDAGSVACRLSANSAPRCRGDTGQNRRCLHA
jgi:hypothetical protein